MKPALFVGSARESLAFAYAVQQNLDHDVTVTVWPQGVFNLSAYPVDALFEAASQIFFLLCVMAALRETLFGPC